MENLETKVDPFEAAKDMQLALMELSFDRRLEVAAGSLSILGQCAAEMDLFDARYVIDCNMAIDRPRQAFGPKQRFINFGDVALEGTFHDFYYTSIGDISGRPINSICASFSNVIMLPDMDKLPNGDILHIPVLAIDQKLRTS